MIFSLWWISVSVKIWKHIRIFRLLSVLVQSDENNNKTEAKLWICFIYKQEKLKFSSAFCSVSAASAARLCLSGTKVTLKKRHFTPTKLCLATSGFVRVCGCKTFPPSAAVKERFQNSSGCRAVKNFKPNQTKMWRKVAEQQTQTTCEAEAEYWCFY